MKKILTIIFLVSTFQIYGQALYTHTMCLYIKDSKNNIDSLILGSLKNSTIGVDDSFGEVNLFGNKIDSLGIRSIQRINSNYHCLNLKFYENLDLKVDYRPPLISGKGVDFDTCLVYNFEITFHAINYPIKIYADIYYLSDYKLYSYMSLLDSYCKIIKSVNLKEYPEPIFLVYDSTIKTIHIHLEPDLGGISSIDKNRLLIYPNPCYNNLTVSDLNFNKGYIELSNIYGQVLKKIEIKNNSAVTFDMTGYSNGLYNILVFDAGKGTFQVNRVVKQ